jgi:peptidoglycan/xylan/chitin deacetylase (PgdA/CDA1 family)
LVQIMAGQPLPQIAWWPDDHDWAVILTHDVERAGGYARVQELADMERDHGLRSAWYFVPERDYDVDPRLVERLWDDGHEVGVHGLRHDGRDMTPSGFASRIDQMRRYADRWGAVGFRSPASQRGWSQVEGLGFDHDSSYSDVARYEPQSGGSCSWLPFFVGDVVELPMTLPMDHTIFELLAYSDGAVWHEKSDLLRSRGGMAVLLTHPDYLDAGYRRQVYVDYLERVAADTSAWHALPRDASAWWRQRSASRIEWGDTGWTVTGPAASRARVKTYDREPASRKVHPLLDLLGSITLTALPIAHDVMGAGLVPFG